MSCTMIHAFFEPGAHVDVGFSRPSDDIVNTWLDEHVPRAYQTGKNLSEAGGVAQLQYTTQSWFISFLFDCLDHPRGVECEDRSQLQDMFREAATKGWITWHSFPCTKEPFPSFFEKGGYFCSEARFF